MRTENVPSVPNTPKLNGSVRFTPPMSISSGSVLLAKSSVACSKMGNEAEKMLASPLKSFGATLNGVVKSVGCPVGMPMSKPAEIPPAIPR